MVAGRNTLTAKRCNLPIHNIQGPEEEPPQPYQGASYLEYQQYYSSSQNNYQSQPEGYNNGTNYQQPYIIPYFASNSATAARQPQSFPDPFPHPDSANTQASSPASQPHPQDEADKGIMGAIAGGAAGAYGGHKVKHGFLGAVGGAILGSKLEDAYKEHHEKKAPKKKKTSWHPFSHQDRPSSSSSSSTSSSSASDDDNSQQKSKYGNFQKTCTDITIDGNNHLIAHCRTISGQYKLSLIDLNDILTNEDGHWKWALSGKSCDGCSEDIVGIVHHCKKCPDFDYCSACFASAGQTHPHHHFETLSDGVGNFAASARNVKLISGDDGLPCISGDLCSCDGQWLNSSFSLCVRIENRDGQLCYVSGDVGLDAMNNEE